MIEKLLQNKNDTKLHGLNIHQMELVDKSRLTVKKFTEWSSIVERHYQLNVVNTNNNLL